MGVAPIHTRMRDAFEGGQSLVIGCSALQNKYRRVDQILAELHRRHQGASSEPDR